MQSFDWIPLPIPLFSATTLFIACVIAVAFVISVFIALAKRSDGPLGPIPGGRLRAGELIQEPPADWRSIGQARFAEIETVSTGKSRTTGLMEYEGSLFIPCDLGFIWRRVSPPARWLMAFVWWIKRWHNDVLADGRVVVRIRGHRYLFEATRVEAQTRIASLKTEIDLEAQKLLGKRLAPREEREGEIWFFRLDPR